MDNNACLSLILASKKRFKYRTFNAKTHYLPQNVYQLFIKNLVGYGKQTIFAENIKLIGMATFKAVILPTQKKADGSYNLKIRVIHNRQVKYIKTPYYVDSKEVGKKKTNGKEELKIKNQSLIDVVDEIILGYKKKLISSGLNFADWNVATLVAYLTSNPSSFSLDFIKYGRDYVSSIKNSGRESTSKKYATAINALVRFIGRETLDIFEINYRFLQAFENHLRHEPAHKGTSSGNAVSINIPKKGCALFSYLSSIKTIYERAKDEYNDEDGGVINIPYSPFKKYKIPALPPPEHRTLSIDQIQRIIDLPYRTRERIGTYQLYNIAKDVFLLSFALMGINIADLHEDNVIDGDIITYCRKKTRTRRKDKAEMKIKIEPQIQPLVDKYKGKNNLFVFSEHYSSSISMNHSVNSGLKLIGREIGVPNLNYYYARRTMASICANKLGVDIARVDEMLNHSDPKLALSRVYIERDFAPLWDANKRLINLFDWGFYTRGAD